MSDDCCKPTYKFENGAYNATEVRLYGLSPSDKSLTLGGREYEVKISLMPKERNKSSKNSNGDHGVEIKSFLPLASGDLKGNILFLGSGAYIESGSDGHQNEHFTTGVIFGYAFEGHCYDLPKPKFMLIPVKPQSIPPGDCGYYEKSSEGYRVWVVDKLQKCVEFEVNQGFVEQLVLEANQPGQRSPSTYRATMAVSHRGGRLT